jgi:hypothetical protein
MIEIITQFPLPYRILHVAARRCSDDPSRFRWKVTEADGLLVAQAAMSFATEAEAFRAGNAAARALRRSTAPGSDSGPSRPRWEERAAYRHESRANSTARK